jgi:hypothetical protein
MAISSTKQKVPGLLQERYSLHDVTTGFMWIQPGYFVGRAGKHSLTSNTVCFKNSFTMAFQMLL